MDTKDKALSYKGRAYQQLKMAIINREVLPGEIINERRVARELNVSRTPVREAIQALQSEGWLLVRPWRGAVVQPVTRKDIMEVSQLRQTLEPMTIELAMNRIGKKEIAYLDSLIARQERISPDMEKSASEFIIIDQDFHLYLAWLSGNGLLLQFMRHLRDRHLRLGMEAVQSETRYIETLNEHMAIVAALKQGDMEGARKAMVFHVMNTRDALLRHTEKTPRYREKTA